MLETKQLLTLAIAIAGAGLMGVYRREIADALRNFRGGGPRPPSHPLPGDDGFVVGRKRRSLN